MYLSPFPPRYAHPTPRTRIACQLHQKLANSTYKLTGCARDMMLLSVWSPLSAGGRQLSRFTLGDLMRFLPVVILALSIICGCQSKTPTAVDRQHAIVGVWQNVRGDDQLVLLPDGQLPDRGVDHHGDPLLPGEWSVVDGHLSIVIPAYRGGDFSVTRYEIETLTATYLSLIAPGENTYQAKHYRRSPNQ